VAESVLSKEDSRRRAQIVKHLIAVADVRIYSITVKPDFHDYYSAAEVLITSHL